MSSFNRRPITIRLNLAEQGAMNELCRFWGKDEKTVMRLAFQQLVIASKQVSDKINTAPEDTPAAQEESCDSTSPESSAPSPSQDC